MSVKQRKQEAVSAPSQGEDPEDPRLTRVNRNIEYIKSKIKFNDLKELERSAEDQSAARQKEGAKPVEASDAKTSPKPKSKSVPKAPADGSKLTIEAKINTPECEKKPEKEKDMRGTYAKLNLIKNKLRSMGQKDPCVMLDDVKEDATPTKATPDKTKSTPGGKATPDETKSTPSKKPYPGYNPQKGVGPQFKP